MCPRYGIIPILPSLLAIPFPPEQVELTGNDDELLLDNNDGILTE